MKDKKNFKAPLHITIKDYLFSYKDELINSFFNYRCKNRTSCKLSIKVQKPELEKYINNQDYEKEKKHICANNNENSTNVINEEESSKI